MDETFFFKKKNLLHIPRTAKKMIKFAATTKLKLFLWNEVLMFMLELLNFPNV